MVIKEKELDVLIYQYNDKVQRAKQINKIRWKKKLLEMLKLRTQ